MKIIEKKQDLFLETNCCYAHCISSDFALGAGIAVLFNKKYQMRQRLVNSIKIDPLKGNSKCIRIDNVFNLITKPKYWQKPTYDSLKEALLEMKEQILLDKTIKRIVMPKIGCGLDRLQWPKVLDIIKIIFKETDLQIIVCYI